MNDQRQQQCRINRLYKWVSWRDRMTRQGCDVKFKTNSKQLAATSNKKKNN